jgi:transcriptional antiterminator NusG
MTEEKVINEEKRYEVSSEKYPAARWFVVQTQSNTEKKATNNLLEAIKLQNAEERILEVFLPIVETVEMRAGQKRKVSRKPFAGYIFVFAIMDDEVFTIIKNTERVIGFPSKNASRPLPLPMPKKEVQSVIDAVDLNKIKEKGKFAFVEGVPVRVVNSELAFHDMVGTIKTCNPERGKAKIEVLIFGRETEVEVPLDSLEVCKD